MVDGEDFADRLEGVSDPRVNAGGSRSAAGRPVRRRRQVVPPVEQPLRVTVEVVAVDGPEGEALQERQDAALLAAL
jgi:hypothetical protein